MTQKAQLSSFCQHHIEHGTQQSMSVAHLQQALAAFPTAFGGPPDAIVLGVNLWDLARWKVQLLCHVCCFLHPDAHALQLVGRCMHRAANVRTSPAASMSEVSSPHFSRFANCVVVGDIATALLTLQLPAQL